MDRFADGTRSIVQCLAPTAPGWKELPCPKQYTMGYPGRAFIHYTAGLFVISAVEVAKDPGHPDKGFEYHLSMSRPKPTGPERCDSLEAKWILQQFGLDGAEEDNHVPFGKVRNFWRAVAAPLVGLECPCKEDEPAIVEDKGDFVWRPITP